MKKSISLFVFFIVIFFNFSLSQKKITFTVEDDWLYNENMKNSSILFMRQADSLSKSFAKPFLFFEIKKYNRPPIQFILIDVDSFKKSDSVFVTNRRIIKDNLNSISLIADTLNSTCLTSFDSIYEFATFINVFYSNSEIGKKILLFFPIISDLFKNMEVDPPIKDIILKIIHILELYYI